MAVMHLMHLMHLCWLPAAVKNQEEEEEIQRNSGTNEKESN